MSIKINQQALEQLSISDLSYLIERFKNQKESLEGVEGEFATKQYYMISECERACITQLHIKIKTVFILDLSNMEERANPFK